MKEVTFDHDETSLRKLSLMALTSSSLFTYSILISSPLWKNKVKKMGWEMSIVPSPIVRASFTYLTSCSPEEMKYLLPLLEPRYCPSRYTPTSVSSDSKETYFPPLTMPGSMKRRKKTIKMNKTIDDNMTMPGLIPNIGLSSTGSTSGSSLFFLIG